MSEPLDLSIDLESVFLPSWAQKPADANRYANHPGDSGDSGRERRGRPFGFGDRNERRGPRPMGGPRSDRPPFRGGPGRGPGGPGGPGGAPGQGGGPGGSLRWDPSRGGPGGPRHGRDNRRFGPDERRQEPPLIPLDVDLKPDPTGVTSLAAQIRMSGRSFPLLDVAGLVMKKPDRYDVTFRVRRNKEGNPEQGLWVCTLDDTVWLSEADAVRHALSAHFDTFYSAQRQPCDPPKGTWTLVAVYENEVLGPPNYHAYQERLRDIYARRGGRLSFDEFKNRVRVVKDEAAVKSWVESQSFLTQFVTLNTDEPRTLASKTEVEAHFKATHAGTVAKSVDTWKLVRGPNLPPLPEPMHRLLRVTLDRETRFPIRMMTALSTDFAHAGLQFFKLNKNAVHVAVARPRYLDVDREPVSQLVRSILDFIHSHPGATRKHLVEALVPAAPAAPAPAPVAEAPAPEAPPAGQEAAAGAAPAADAAPSTPATPESSSAERQLLADLHWLVHQGHVIEFHTGVLEVARKPAPRPEPPAQQPAKPKADRPEGQRKNYGRRVSDNLGLLPLPAPAPALVG